MEKILVLNKADNTGIAVSDVIEGETVHYEIENQMITLTAAQAIPFGFKIALQYILKGADIIKYGEAIGAARKNIGVGELVHVQNVEGKRGRGDLLREKL